MTDEHNEPGAKSNSEPDETIPEPKRGFWIRLGSGIPLPSLLRWRKRAKRQDVSTSEEFSSAEETAPTAEVAKPEAEEEATELKVAKPKRKLRWRILEFAFRVVVYGTVLAALLMVAGWAVISATVEGEDIADLLKQLVEEQTGGKLDIGSTEFNVLTGLSLKNVQFYAPELDDTRGFHNGGSIQPIPLANFDALEINYSIPRLFAGRMHIKALQLIEPQFHLRQTDGVFNFQSILDFRADNYPEQPDLEPPEKPQEDAKVPESEDKDEPAGKSLLVQYAPALVFLPFDIMATNIGIKNLKLDMIKQEGDDIVQVLTTSGLTFDMGLHWFALSSEIWFSMLNPFENPFELDIREVARDEDGNYKGELKQQLLVETALNFRFEFLDLQKLKLDFAMRTNKLATPIASYDDFSTYANILVNLHNDYHGVNIEKLNVSVADALEYDLQGDVSSPDDQFKAFNLSLRQQFGLDLANAAKLAKPFAPSLKGDGKIRFQDLRIEGEVDPEKLTDVEKPAPLPYVSGVIWFEEVLIDYPEIGVSMKPLAGNVSVAAGPAMTGMGSQVDLAVDMVIPGVEANRVTPVGSVKAGVKDMSVKLTTRALWPQLIAPILKLNVEAENVYASGEGIAPVDVPLFVDMDGDGRQDLKRMGLSLNFELTDLAEFSLMADCQNRCSRFRTSTMSRLDSLKKLHAIGLPIAGMVGAGKFMPSRLDGAIDFQLSARGRMKDPLVTPPDELLKTGDIRFNSQFALSKLNTDVPFMDVKLRDFETRLLLGGNLKQQKIELSQEFDKLSLALPGEPGSEPKKVEVDRYAFDTTVVNDIEGPLNLASPLKQLITAVETKLFVGKVGMKGTLPRPISNFQLDVGLRQERLADFNLKQVKVSVPDFGTNVTVDAKTTVSDKFLPKNLRANVAVKVEHSGDERIPGGIETSGTMGVRVSVATDDALQLDDSGQLKLDKFTVETDGELEFKKFNIKIPGKDKDDKPTNLLLVEEIVGQIPFKQTVDVPAVLAKIAEFQKQDEVETGDVAAEAAVDPLDELLVAGGGKKSGPDVGQTIEEYFAKTEDNLSSSTNVVALVDYGTVRPFFPDKTPLSIKRLVAANLELSRMEFDVELRQNWFALNQFVINFLGGKIQGDFQLAFDPLPKSMKTSLHLTRLDTTKMIERIPDSACKPSGGLFGSNPYLDSTVHFKLDFLSNDFSGDVAITSIGKDQLKMMLCFVDPYERDPAIGQIKTALTFGEVRQVLIPIKNGEMDLDVDVRVVTVPIPLPKVTRFPIRQIIQNFLDQARSKNSAPKAKDSNQDGAAQNVGA